MSSPPSHKYEGTPSLRYGTLNTAAAPRATQRPAGSSAAAQCSRAAKSLRLKWSRAAAGRGASLRRRRGGQL